MEKVNEHDKIRKSKSQFDWKDYENLIHKIYTELGPDLDVRKYNYIQDWEPGKKRQIDIPIRSRIAGHKILIILQVKKIKRLASLKC